MQKSYLYKIYRGSTYLGLLDNVLSDFSVVQDINTIGGGITVQVGADPDVAGLFPGYLLTEEGDYITDESGNRLTLERYPDIVGNSHDQILMRNGNKIRVYEVSDTYPNGKLMFSGVIYNWEASFGSSEPVVTLTCYSDAVELGNYVISTGTAIDVNNLTGTNQGFVISNGGPTLIRQMWQSFAPNADTVCGAKVAMSERGIEHQGAIALVELFASRTDAESSGSPNLMASASMVIDGLTQADYYFDFLADISVTPGSEYFLRVSQSNVTGSNALAVYNTSSDVYPDGRTNSRDFVTWGVPSASADANFAIYTSQGSTTAIYEDTDPGDMIKDFMDRYIDLGGIITYTGGSIDLTSNPTDYTFKLATIKDGIDKALELAPSDWYWFVDMTTNILYYQQTGSVADYTLVKGVDITELKLKATIEYVKNMLYFSGGDTGGGVNLLTQYADLASQTDFGIQLATSSDNRVTLESTADIIGNSFVDEFKDEQYSTTVTIVDGNIDTTLIRVGQLLNFAGYGGFVDQLLLQIVRVEYKPEITTLTLGILPKRQIIDVDKINSAVAALQTVDNPDTAE